MNSKNNLGKILVVAVTVIITVIMFFLIAQRVGSYVSVQAQITLEKLSLEQDRERLTQLEKISGQQAEIMDSIEACERLMPAQPREDELIRYIQGVADNSLADFIQIAFDPRTNTDKYSVMPVKISFSGNYQSLIKFLDEIGKGDRAVRVDSVSVTSAGTNGTDIKAELAASAFYMGTTAGTGNGEAAAAPAQ